MTPVFRDAGAEKAVCGYSGGEEADPSYEDVKAQKTGHRETIMVEYDPGRVSYDKLLDIYLENVDPFDAGGQFIASEVLHDIRENFSFLVNLLF